MPIALATVVLLSCSDDFSSGTEDAGAGGSGAGGVGGAGAVGGSAGGGTGGGGTGGASGSGGASGEGGTAGTSSPDAAIDAPVDAPLDAYASAVLADSPVAYWRLDDASASTTAEDSANDFDGTYTGVVAHPVPGLLTSIDNGAAEFGNSSTAFVDFGDVLDFEGGVAFSIELWVQPTGNEDDLLVEKATNPEGHGYSLRTTPTGGVFQLQSAADLAGATFPKLTLSAPTHLVATFDGSLACVHANAVKQPCIQKTITLPNTSAKLRVGGHFAGVIDEVAIYDRVLTSAEIADHYAIGKGN
jgi:hypothetical protein